jgi:hypothetical protein
VLEAFATALDAQSRAVRRLQAPLPAAATQREKGMSQVEYVYDILRRAGTGLHITDIIARVEKVHRVRLERESLVSALTKKVQRGDRFVRSGPNVFTLKSTGGR